MAAKSRLEFAMICEFRNPAKWPRPFLERYHDAIDHIVWAEGLGYDTVYFTEHHFSHDEYLPSPLMTAAIVAERTKRIGISTAVLLLPFYHPVRLAEEGAFLDQLSNGRYELGFGTGYRPEEYAGYGIEWAGRGARTDEMIEIIRRLWEEDTVTFHGRHFQIDKARISPKPVQKPRPRILVGGFAPLATRRAARLGDGLLNGPDYVNQYATYVAAMNAAGRDPASGGCYGGHPWVYVSEDPERTWSEIGPYVLYHIDCYSMWGQSNLPRMNTTDDLEASGIMRVVTPEQMIAEIEDMGSKIDLKRYHFFMNPGGIPLKLMREPIETFARKVIPAFR